MSHQNDLFSKITDMIKKRSKKIIIGLPEGESEKILTVAKKLLNINVKPILFYKDKNDIPTDLPKGIEIVLINDSVSKQYIDQLLEIRKEKLTREKATKLLKNTNYVAMMKLYMGELDAIVGGINFPTSEILRPALQIIKTKDGLASSVIIMKKDNAMFLFGDCALNLNPDSKQLSLITNHFINFAKYFNLVPTPKVALLSYSSGSSGAGVSVDKVKQAYEILKNKNKDDLIYGPIQFDAAFSKTVQEKKIIDCPLKGPANIYIFPDLNSGNIGYKIAQRIGGYEAIGPIILGLNKPVMDLSRGANIDDIYKTCLLVCGMVIKDEKNINN